MESGDIYRHDRFYRDAFTGELKRKFLVFFLGIIGDPLPLKTWVDLRWLADVDPLDIIRMTKHGVMAKITTLPPASMKPLLECAASADDTTRQQEQALRDQLARMP